MSQLPAFRGYCYPLPNMLVQSGTKVLIKDLTSESGVLLNGRYGTAVQFYPHRDARWSVKLDDEKEDDKKIVLIRITNLSWAESNSINIAFFFRDQPGWTELSENGRFIIRAGTKAGDDGCQALCLLDDPNRTGFSLAPIYAQAKIMGIPEKLIRDLVDGYKKQTTA